ncbi:hypothetical protein GCM10009609_37260 [Pseudonocardia aurantiaca]
MSELVDCGRIAELGSGSAKKTRLLLAACAARRGTTYLPIDVCRTMLETSGAALTAMLPSLGVTGIRGRYEAGLAWLHASAEPVVVAYGSGAPRPAFASVTAARRFSGRHHLAARRSTHEGGDQCAVCRRHSRPGVVAAQNGELAAQH